MEAQVLIVNRGTQVQAHRIGPNDFKSIQKAIGGWATRMSLSKLGPAFRDLAVYMNEDAIPMGLPVHKTPFFDWPIYGNYVVVREDNHGNFTSLTDAEIVLLSHLVLEQNPS